MTSLLDAAGAAPGLDAVMRRGKGVVSGVPIGATGLLVAWLQHATGRTVLVLSAEPESLFHDLGTWGGDAALGLFPAADTPPFDRVPPSDEVTRRRLGSLRLLAAGQPAVIVASPQGVARPTLPPALLRDGVSVIRRGDKHDRDELLRRLVELGHRRVVAVSSPGDFAVRGGIVDVFGLDRARPWRAEWFGDEVEGLRAFDVDTQTSVAKLDEVTIGPARELDLRPESVAAAAAVVAGLDIEICRPEVRDAWERDVAHLAEGAYDDGVDLFYPYLVAAQRSLLTAHLPQGALLVCAGGRDRLMRAAQRHLEEVEKLCEQEAERGELPGGAVSGLISAAELETMLDGLDCIELVREAESPDADIAWTGVDAFAGKFEALGPWLKTVPGRGGSVVVVTRQQQRVEELLRESRVEPVDSPDFSAATEFDAGAVVVAQADLGAGFLIPHAQIAVVTDHEVLGVTKRRGSPLTRGARSALSTSARGSKHAASGRAAAQAFVLQFQPGDLVVHRDHGIGRFVEMRTVSTDDGDAHEYMTLEYADSNKLYVPVAHLDRVDRYIGGADSAPTLSRLGTGEWERTKRRVKERTEEVARELLQLYSRREMSPGHAFEPDGAWQRDLEESFAFEETPDQELVLDEIKRDMEASKPMDRVVCGDVGFGKTEVALRAAFKAAAEGRQVAVLVPTTVLSQQHFLTFSERLRPFPLTIGQLSRFCTPDDIRRTLEGLKNGSVDIVVGTHRLLQRDVVFKNLGLVVVDEEQRFGVLQKERFKELRVGVDVLSLSATPIPRTLHMSLAGIRDLSVIQSPPEERQPIKTYVTAREPGLIREVVTRELSRSGQVFYVHNRVQTIQKEADDLRKLVPEARIEIGHGQMDEGMLASVMRRFIDGEIDVLVATTIIESGLDIPNANTIIINDANRFGLAQLYQLRGRVGRSGNRAYAYMLYPPQRSLTEKADKRLEVIAELQDLGSGFKLAMRDLEIRGAGNLLGEEQSGEIAAVGLELYNHLLGQAVGVLRGKPVVESPAQVTVSLPLAAFLPPAFVGDERLRLRCYQELAACVDERQLEKCATGLADRFGTLPVAAQGLVYSLRVRLLAAACGAASVEQQGVGVIIQLSPGHGLDLEAVARQFRQWLTSSPTRLHLNEPKGRPLAGTEWQEVLTASLRELGRLVRTRPRSEATV